jgi:hypothetical protein
MPLLFDEQDLQVLAARPGTAATAVSGAFGAGGVHAMQNASTSFDLVNANTLFWKQVPVLLRHPDREEQQEDVTFRIMTGVSRVNNSLRVGGQVA